VALIDGMPPTKIKSVQNKINADILEINGLSPDQAGDFLMLKQSAFEPFYPESILMDVMFRLG
jgi:hypothetical protein